MGLNYANNNLHALITFGEVEAFKRPGLDVQARIDAAAELLIVIRADLKNKYGDDPCTDLGIIKDKLEPELDRIQDLVDIELTSKGMPYMDNADRNEIIKSVFQVRKTLIEIAAREDLFDKTSIPSGNIPEPAGGRRLKPGGIAE